MSNLPFVSVVIPVFERPEVLEVVLGFFEYQSYPKDRFEIIVVDDGSKEQIGRSLESRAFGYQLRISTQKNRGRAAARNRGVDLAGGEFVLFGDADRIPDPEWISAHASFHSRFAGCAAVGVPWDCFYSFEKLKTCSQELIPKIRQFSRQPKYFQMMTKLFQHETTSSPVAWAGFLVGNSSIRRADLRRAGGFDEDLTTWGIEHFEFGLRLMEDHGIKICYHSAAASYHIPNSRQPEYYRAGIQEGVAVLARKHTGRNLALLRDFLFGDISLQEFEIRYGKRVSEAIAAEDPIYFTHLVRTSRP